MPYIDRKLREQVDNQILDLAKSVNENAGTPDGALNYAITRLLQATLLRDGTSYQLIERAVGVLECCKLELYRRVAAPYEDGKAGQNGDVYR